MTSEEPKPSTRLRFVAGDRSYELPLGEVREVAVPPVPVARIPRTRPPIRGAGNLRGRVVALVELAGLLGRPPSTRDPSLERAVLLEGTAVALIVDEVIGFAADPDPEAPVGAEPAPEPLAAAGLLAQVERLLHDGPRLGYLHLSTQAAATEPPWPSAS